MINTKFVLQTINTVRYKFKNRANLGEIQSAGCNRVLAPQSFAVDETDTEMPAFFISISLGAKLFIWQPTSISANRSLASIIALKFQFIFCLSCRSILSKFEIRTPFAKCESFLVLDDFTCKLKFPKRCRLNFAEYTLQQPEATRKIQPAF